MKLPKPLLFGLIAALFLATGFVQSWNVSLTILNMAIISAIMALGVNIQWGFAGLFNAGVMGFVALGGLAAVLIAMPPNTTELQAGGLQVLAGLLVGAASITLAVVVGNKVKHFRRLTIAAILVIGFFVYRGVITSGISAIEAIEPAVTGNIGGLGLPILLAWPAGAFLAGCAAWAIGRTALGLRSDYLAIATLGIAEIIIAVLKNEDWLARGVKNVVGLPRPVPYEGDLQQSYAFVEQAEAIGLSPVLASTYTVQLSYTVLFGITLLTLVIMAERALNSPWGRMMRAIRDNEVSAQAMGKNVTARHLQVFVVGSAVCGLAGAMMTTLDGQLTPGTYQPLRFTFLIWVMVIVGGSGNNYGAVLGGFLVWWLWVQAEPLGLTAMQFISSGLADESSIKAHLIDSVAYFRLFAMGAILLAVLRFSPRGLIPEK